MSLAFDTLAYAQQMESVGFTRAQAEALAQTQAKLIDDRLATKTDLTQNRNDLELKIEQLRIEMNHNFEIIRQEIKSLENKMTIKLGAHCDRWSCRVRRYYAFLALTRYKALQQRIEQTGTPAYLPYVLLGYPTAEKSLDVCRVLAGEGVDGFELGLPFRDPVADGPLIQEAANIALDAGFKVADAIEQVRQIRTLAPDAPLTLMAYYNMVIARGAEKFIADFAWAGIDGLLVPDLPIEQAHELSTLARQHGMASIFIASPLSDERRLKMLGEAGSGFVYVVTRLGITGVDTHYSATLSQLFSRVHTNVNLPAFAGFGISEPEHAARMVAAGADGVIVGSRIVQLIQAADHDNWQLATLAAHTRSMLETLRSLRVLRAA